MRLRKYERDDSHAYTFGVFPTLELIQHQPDSVSEILLHSSGVRNEGIAKIKALCQQLGIRVSVDDKLVERLESKENTYAVGVFQKYERALNAGANHVLLVNPSDMGNLGNILRTMLGFGFQDLALIKPAVDIFDPRSIRASMGALFQVNFAYYDSLDTYRADFQHALYPFMTNGEVVLGEATFTPPFTLAFGSESSGLPESYRKLGTSVTIPQTKAIDSLNLSVAIGIALYEAGKKG
ncbi:MAG: TrmH family RNA methyltransferase [Chloroflexi bacterium]|nr:TrmH family RNA methyltransferase [Chloroflexota bacterium]MCC6892082.1 TrmH family RNA methyltransferase [Anaerolineae bacterium]